MGSAVKHLSLNDRVRTRKFVFSGITELTDCVSVTDFNNCSFSPASLQCVYCSSLCQPTNKDTKRGKSSSEARPKGLHGVPPAFWPVLLSSCHHPYLSWGWIFLSTGVQPRGAVCIHQHFLLTGALFKVPFLRTHYPSFYLCGSEKIWMQVVIFMTFEILSGVGYWNSSNAVKRDLHLKMQ